MTPRINKNNIPLHYSTFIFQIQKKYTFLVLYPTNLRNMIFFVLESYFVVGSHTENVLKIKK